jgi:NAD(P)-dependent dehydrogenase (short-subunit alcohol dehydrogenase family)
MIENLKMNNSLAGKRCLITGGNRGLGVGISVLLNDLGCDVTVATRSADAIVTLSPTKNATVVHLDLANLGSLCSAVFDQQLLGGGAYDVVVLNAGVAPSANKPTVDGFELALGTNCIGNMFLSVALQAKGIFSPGAKLVVVTSETHRTVPPLDLVVAGAAVPALHAPAQYGGVDAMKFYARSKLCLTTVAQELARRFAPAGVSVHTICPGPVATDITRGAPPLLRGAIDAILSVVFQTPARAARPIALLAALPLFAGGSGSYHHMYAAKPARADATDAERGAALWMTLAAAIDTRVAALAAATVAADIGSDGRTDHSRRDIEACYLSIKSLLVQ